MVLNILIGVGVSVLLLLAGWISYTITAAIRNDITEWVHKITNYRLDNLAKKKQIELNSVRVLSPDENGRQGIVYNGETFVNMDTGERFNELKTLYLDPMRIQLDNVQRTLLALRGTNLGQSAIPEILESQEKPISAIPEKISLGTALQQFNIQPSIHNLFLGVSLDENGQLRPIVGDMQKMVHMLISGASGWGKSTLMEAMAKQLALSGDCELCFVDYGVNTFGMLADYGKYPIADDVDHAVLLFEELIKEGHRRKELLREYPQAKTIDAYNLITGQDLKPLVCFVDESASLFREEETKGPITELAQMARKFGMWLVLGGTDFKASTIPSSCTGNCGARVGFHLMPGISRSLLNTSDAFNLSQKGRALALMPGQKMTEIQCPIVDNWSDMPKTARQESLPEEETFDEQVRRIAESLGSDANISAVCRELGLHTGGDDFYRVREAMKRLDRLHE